MNIRWVVWSLVLMMGGACGNPSLCSSAAGQSAKPNAGESKEKQDPDDVITVDCVARITRHFDADRNPHYSADVSDLVLEGAMKYRLKIKVVNPHDETIRFSRVEMSDGSATFETEKKEIPGLGTADFVMDFVTLNGIVSTFGGVRATFYSIHKDLTLNFRLNVTYTIQGAFGFHTSEAIVELPKDEAVVIAKLPFVLLEPVTLEMLELYFTRNLRDLRIRIVTDDPEATAPYIEIEVPRQALPRQGLTGVVGLRRIGSERMAGVTMSFRHHHTFALRPESMRLWRDNHSKPYQAFAMLRIHHEISGDEEKTDESDSKPAVPATPEVALSIDGKPAIVRVRQMGQSQLYRLTIQHDGPFEADDDGTVKVRWRVLANGEEHVIESHAFVPDR